MDLRKAIFCKKGLGAAVMLYLLVVSLSSCDVGISADNSQPGQTGSLPEAASSSVELELAEHSGEDDTGFVMSMFEGCTTVFLNGEERELTVAPFIHNDSFYYPLEDVVELLGGGFSQVGDTATINLFGVAAQYTAGQPEVVINGEIYRNDYRLQGYSGQTDNEDFHPLMVEGKMFIPHDIHPYASPSFGLNITRAVSEAHMLMLGHPEGRDGKQLGIEDVRLYDAFEELPD